MPKTVLVCDDELYILESVSFVVRQEGYNVITAEQGDVGLRLAGKRSGGRSPGYHDAGQERFRSMP